MAPMRVLVQRVVDFGTVVSMVGINDDTGDPVVIHVDQRPFQSFWGAWRQSGFQQPIEYSADQLVLSVELHIDEALEPQAYVVRHD